MQAILTTTTANPVMHTSSKSPGSLPTHRRTKHRHQCHESSDQEAEIHCLDENSWLCRRGSRGPILSTAQPTNGDSVTVKTGALTNNTPINDGLRCKTSWR